MSADTDADGTGDVCEPCLRDQGSGDFDGNGVSFMDEWQGTPFWIDAEAPQLAEPARECWDMDFNDVVNVRDFGLLERFYVQ